MHTQQSQYLKPEIESKIDLLLAKMTLLEKVGQLTQLGPSIVGGFDFSTFMENPDPEMFKNVQRDFHEDWIRKGEVGSYLGVMGADETNRLQKIAVEEFPPGHSPHFWAGCNPRLPYDLPDPAGRSLFLGTGAGPEDRRSRCQGSCLCRSALDFRTDGRYCP